MFVTSSSCNDLTDLDEICYQMAYKYPTLAYGARFTNSLLILEKITVLKREFGFPWIALEELFKS